MKSDFGIITTATKAYVDSIVQIFGKDSTINNFKNDAWYFYQVGDFGHAISRFNRILYLDSLNPNPFWGYGLILSSRCKTDSAILYLNKAFGIDSTNARLRCDLAYTLAVKASTISDSLIKIKEYDKSIAEFRNRQYDFEHYPVLRLQFAEILAAAGDSTGANEQLALAKKTKQRIDNAIKIIKHLQQGGTLHSYICD